jgi:hypothetical protein
MKFLLLLVLVACASEKAAPPKKIEPVVQIDPTSIESKQLANEQESSYVRDVKFGRGKSALLKSQMAALRELYKEASVSGTVKQAKVLTWGDQEYPAKKDQKLAPREQEIVDSRNKNITQFLKTLNKEMEIEALSMAERPSRWDKFLSTEEARMKANLEDSGIPKAGEKVPVDMKAKKSTATIIFINH